MREHKIVILGSMGSGKTTALRAIAQGKVVSTDVANSDKERSDKATTTVAMDYGDIPLPNGDRLRVYGTPGQERFGFIWPIIARGAAGGIVLLDATLDDPHGQLDTYLDVLREKTPDLPVVVGVTKVDLVEESTMDGFFSQLKQRRQMLPLMKIDAREYSSVMMMMDALMSEIETHQLMSQIL